MRFVPAALFVTVGACAAAPLYETQTEVDGRPYGLAVHDGGEGCPEVRLRVGRGDWARTGEAEFAMTLNEESASPDCTCAFDQDAPFVPADHFDLTEAKAACEAARSADAAP